MRGRVVIIAVAAALAAVGGGVRPAGAEPTTDLSVTNGNGDGTALSPAGATAELNFDVEDNTSPLYAATLTLTPPPRMTITAVKLDDNGHDASCTQQSEVWTCVIPKAHLGLVDVYAKVPKNAALKTSDFDATVAPPDGVSDSDQSNNAATAPLRIIPTVKITGKISAGKFSTTKLGTIKIPVGAKTLFKCTLTNNGPDDGAKLTLSRNALPSKGSTGWKAQDKATGKHFKYQRDERVSLSAGQSVTVGTYITLTKKSLPKLYFGCSIQPATRYVNVVEQIAWPQDGMPGVGVFIEPKSN